jgi:hypothetical protein
MGAPQRMHHHHRWKSFHIRHFPPHRHHLQLFLYKRKELFKPIRCTDKNLFPRPWPNESVGIAPKAK